MPTNHDTRTATTGRRRHVPGLLAVIAVASLWTAVLPTAQAASAGGSVDVLACEDISPSFAAATRAKFNETLTARLRAYVNVSAPKIRSGAPARRGLNVVVRPVGKASFAAANSFEVRMQPLPPITALSDDESVETTLARLRATKVRAALVNANRQTMEQFTSALTSWAPPVRNGSDITGCVLAAGELLGGPAPHFYLVTDLIATTAPPSGNQQVFTATAVTVIQSCNDPATCEARRTEWEGHFRRLGATQIRFARPEQIADVIPSLG